MYRQVIKIAIKFMKYHIQNKYKKIKRRIQIIKYLLMMKKDKNIIYKPYVQKIKWSNIVQNITYK